MTRKAPQYRPLHTKHIAQRQKKRPLIGASVLILLLAFLIGIIAPGCSKVTQPRGDVRPLVMHDVPAKRLAFRLEADTGLPADLKTEDANDKVEAIQTAFNTNRKDDALVRTVTSPDGQRSLALYGTADEPNEAFRIDIYSD